MVTATDKEVDLFVCLLWSVAASAVGVELNGRDVERGWLGWTNKQDEL